MLRICNHDESPLQGEILGCVTGILRSTMSVERPCCPASLFFSSPIVPEEKDPPCVQRLSQKELCCLRRFFERGHPIFAAPAADPTTKPSARWDLRCVGSAFATHGLMLEPWPVCYMEGLPFGVFNQKPCCMDSFAASSPVNVCLSWAATLLSLDWRTKMWPWMRDLPSSIWAGRGLAYEEQNGLRRLSCAGGAEAMHGVQVWGVYGSCRAASCSARC